MKRKLISIVLSLIILMISNVFANATSIIEDKSDSLINLGEFKDDSVIAVLKEEYSGIYKEFTEEDFSEIDVKNIKDLSHHIRDFIENKKAEKSSEFKGNDIEISDEEIIAEYDLNIKNFKNFICIELNESGKEKVLEAVEKLNKREDVLCASPNFIIYTDSTYPNDYYYQSANVNDRQWAIDSIQLPEAWDITTGSNTVRIGVLDSGIDINHPDLSGKVNATLSEDFVYSNTATVDIRGHGTHVAGIIGAKTNNQIGMAGTCWNVELVSLKVFGNNGEGTIGQLVYGINSANTKGIDILNFSGGTFDRWFVAQNGQTTEPLLEAIRDFNGLLVCSSGNGKDIDGDGIPDITCDTDIIEYYPCSYGLNNIISVTSINDCNQLPEFRNYGSYTVDLAAPGEDILSTVPTSVSSNGYIKWSGTSMATPYVTGVAALMLSINPNLTPVQIKNIILSTVDKHSSLTDKVVSGGKLNAYKAVLGAKNNYTYLPVAVHGGRFFYTDDTDWFGTSCTNRVMTARINNDGKTDLLAINYDGDICYSLNNGRGTYQNQTKITFSGFSPSWFWNTYNRRVWVADVNGDNYDDLIGVSIAGKIYTAINNQNNTFSLPVMRTGTAFVSSSGWFSNTARERVWPGDINGDGRADLMGISTAGHVYYALANSNGGYGNETKITVTNGFANSWFSKNYNNRIWVADVNADGYDDFIGVSVDGHIYTSINNGNFTFTTPTNKGGVAFASSSAWFSTAHSGRVWPADLNADGRCDIVGISTDGNVYSCTANANGTYNAEVRNLVVDGTKYGESWFSNTCKSRMFIGFVDRYAAPDFIAISSTGYAHVSLQLCKQDKLNFH